MTQEDFDRWVTILRANFPDHPRLGHLGRSGADFEDGLYVARRGFFPRTPDEAAAREARQREEHLRTHPIVEMRGSHRRKAYPEEREALDWLTIVRPGDPLFLVHRDRGQLVIATTANGDFSLRCLGSNGDLRGEASAFDVDAVRSILLTYLRGDTDEVLRTVRQSGGGFVA